MTRPARGRRRRAAESRIERLRAGRGPRPRRHRREARDVGHRFGRVRRVRARHRSGRTRARGRARVPRVPVHGALRRVLPDRLRVHRRSDRSLAEGDVHHARHRRAHREGHLDRRRPLGLDPHHRVRPRDVRAVPLGPFVREGACASCTCSCGSAAPTRLLHTTRATFVFIGTVTVGLGVSGLIDVLTNRVVIGGVVALVLYIFVPFALWWSCRGGCRTATATSSASLPGAVVFAFGVEILHVFTIVWFPHSLESKSEIYGAIGIALGAAVLGLSARPPDDVRRRRSTSRCGAGASANPSEPPAFLVKLPLVGGDRSDHCGRRSPVTVRHPETGDTTEARRCRSAHMYAPGEQGGSHVDSVPPSAAALACRGVACGCLTLVGACSSSSKPRGDEHEHDARRPARRPRPTAQAARRSSGCPGFNVARHAREVQHRSASSRSGRATRRTCWCSSRARRPARALLRAAREVDRLEGAGLAGVVGRAPREPARGPVGAQPRSSRARRRRPSSTTTTSAISRIRRSRSTSVIPPTSHVRVREAVGDERRGRRTCTA